MADKRTLEELFDFPRNIERLVFLGIVGVCSTLGLLLGLQENFSLPILLDLLAPLYGIFGVVLLTYVFLMGEACQIRTVRWMGLSTTLFLSRGVPVLAGGIMLADCSSLLVGRGIDHSLGLFPLIAIAAFSWFLLEAVVMMPIYPPLRSLKSRVLTLGGFFVFCSFLIQMTAALYRLFSIGNLFVS